MQASTRQKLIDLNREFYQTFGAAFAATRRRLQPGVWRVLSEIPLAGSWLDLGCGSGALAAEWAHQKRQGLYLGLDFSPPLLNEARQAAVSPPPGLTLAFQPADLSDPAWPQSLPAVRWDGLLAFAVLHHIPGADLRLQILRQVRALLPPGGVFIHSEWQFQHSPRLLERVQPWEQAGFDADELDPGDTLLDWRHTLPGQPPQVGLRYVHRFERAELRELAESCGFIVAAEFESDGEGGRLGLYQRWQAV